MLLAALASCRAGTQRHEPVEGMFRGGPGHHGTTAPAQAHFIGIRWRFQTAGPVRSSAVLAGSEVFVGSGDGHLYCLDLATGTERWRFDAGESVTSTPLVTATGVAFTTLAGAIIRLNRTSGLVEWRAVTGKPAPLVWGFEGTDFYSSSPVLVDGVLVAGGADGAVYGLDWDSGAVRWSTMTGGRVRSSPAAADSTVYIGSFDGKLYALDVKTGSARWTFASRGTALNSADFGYDRRSIQSSPVIRDSIVYIGSRDGHLYAIDRETGREVWKYAHDETSWVIATPATRDSLVIDGSSDAHFVHALRVADGSEVWRQKTYHSVWGSPLIAGDVVVVPEGAYDGLGHGLLRSFDLATGTERSRIVLGGPVLSTPAIAGDLVVVGSDDGAVYGIGLGTGSVRRAVYWDSATVQFGLGRTASRVRDHFRGRGYELVSSSQLRTWMEGRLTDSTPSVVVFAIDHAPREVAATSADSTLFRRYLNAGGKIVWTGLPPHMWLADSSGKFTLTTFGKGGTQGLLGVPIQVEPWDRYGATPTALGRQWGLSGWWLTAWSSPDVGDATVLAMDERGYAAVWARRYGGPPGSGFIQAGRPVWDDASLLQLAILAEYSPAAPSAAR
jgi:outer membrane protein assembly factor BamB